MKGMDKVHEILHTWKTALEGYIRCQQGVRALGDCIFGGLEKTSPEMLTEMGKEIRETEILDYFSRREGIYKVVSCVLTAVNGIDELVTITNKTYAVLVQRYNYTKELKVPTDTPCALHPDDYMGLTLYADQLLADFQSVLQETGQPVGYRHAAWGMALDVEDALKELRGSLKAMI